MTFWSGSSEVFIYTPVVGRPFPALAGMMADELSKALCALAALIAELQENPEGWNALRRKDCGCLVSLPSGN